MNQTSRYLARLLGPVGVIVGLGMLLNQPGYLAMAGDFMKNPALVYVGSVLGLLGGVALVLAHNVWIADWRVLITLVGWLSILDSASWLLFPAQMQQFWTPAMTGSLPLISGIIVLVVGAVLAYYGYATKAAGKRR